MKLQSYFLYNRIASWMPNDFWSSGNNWPVFTFPLAECSIWVSQTPRSFFLWRIFFSGFSVLWNMDTWNLLAHMFSPCLSCWLCHDCCRLNTMAQVCGSTFALQRLAERLLWGQWFWGRRTQTWFNPDFQGYLLSIVPRVCFQFSSR